VVDSDAKINQLQIEVSALKERAAFFNIFYAKLDETLTRVQGLMEERRDDINEDLKDVYKKIDDVEKRIMNEMSELRNQMSRQHEEEKKKISDLDKWRWMVMGGAAVVGWIISKITFPFTD
jgi:predicted  nucleic acid-binding Zn-ribbon protein